MQLSEFFNKHKKIALSFSGGVDSAYLLYAASKANIDVVAYYVKSEFQPEFELEDAKRLAKELGACFRIIEFSPFEANDEEVLSNPSNRCYYCKKNIMGLIKNEARKDGYQEIMDGTNASDIVDDRPGVRALEELKICSPLRECGLTKDMIRTASKEAGLFTWNKASYACLATRIQTGIRLSKEDLSTTEKCEGFLAELGYYDFRIRMRYIPGETGMIKRGLVQVKKEQKDKLLMDERTILEELSKSYDEVVFDKEYRS